MDQHQIIQGDQLKDLVKQLTGWQLREEQLYREFKFKDFKAAFAFMTEVALIAEKINHHPNWENAYNKVIIRLWTHESGGITPHDVELARAINQISAGTQA